MITGSAFGTDWASAEPRVRRFLATQGALGSAADDIVQEVAARALATELAYATVDDLVRWACTVARNLHVSEHRRSSRLRPPLDSDPPMPTATEHEALRRLEVEETLQAIARMSARDQRALLGQLQPPPHTGDRKADVRNNVALFRARGRLMRLLAAFTAVLATRSARWRRTAERAVLVTAAAGAIVPLTVVTLRPLDPPSRSTDSTAPLAAAAQTALAAAHARPAEVREPGPRLVPRGPARTWTGTSNPSPVAAPVPVLVVHVPTPVGEHTTTVREKRPDDPILCIEAYLVLPEVCVRR